MPGDNVAIATRRLAAGTVVQFENQDFELSATILEGHRFAIRAIEESEPLLSWGLPFGRALRRINPGEYICNAKILKALAERHVDFSLPPAANFFDYRLPFALDERSFHPGVQVPRHRESRTFQGYFRPDERGVGTRNYIIVLGTTSRAGAFVRTIAQRLNPLTKDLPHCHGIVPIDHTELGGFRKPNNAELILRTLAGFMINPNVGAVLAIDFGNEPVNNRHLKDYLAQNGYSIAALPHKFLSIGNEFESKLVEAEKTIKDWLPDVAAVGPTPHSIEHLKLGLQCGGSDAFSGVSGNPLVGILSRETVACGGSANLAETDELIGAESYVLSNVRDLATAKAFLDKIERFQRWAAWHGHTAEGNPSGGNMYRGLYNIAIKSIGAARKKDPRTRLDFVIDYAERMTAPGIYFMDSPGNDLESIAGQVAAGCNMILFATGNGSITNFPFVPTIKIMTTTGRYQLVHNEMDFNAGRYQDGEDLEALGREAFDQMIEIASGTPSAGERAGHSQVQLWREWRHTSAPQKIDVGPGLRPGIPIKTPADFPASPKVSLPTQPPTLGLILPTSLCAGQIAQMIAQNLNREIQLGKNLRISRFVALPHTEGCGNSAGESEELFLRTMAGYLAHPLVKKALLLEHGCEKTHNDAFRNSCAALGISTADFGFASIQMDGGIQSVSNKVRDWFVARDHASKVLTPCALAVGFVATDSIPEVAAQTIRRTLEQIVASGGTVVFAETGSECRLWDRKFEPTLSYGQKFNTAGLHIMETHGDNLLETITGLAATGVELLLLYSNAILIQGNPLVPTLQIGSEGSAAIKKEQVDLMLGENEADLLSLLQEASAGDYIPRSVEMKNTGFQISRGRLGISL
jgi:altronate dehydratase